MKYVIDKKSKKPAYLQLYEQVREDIVGRIYTFGKKLPSKRLISDELGISTVTVEHAYGLLCEEGYVEAKERSGYFVSFRTDDFFAAPKSKASAPLNRGSQAEENHSGDISFSVLAKTMRKVLADYGEAIMERADNMGCAKLRTAISHYLERNRGIKSTPGQIVIGSGAEYLYGLIVELLGRERIYGLESPSYEKIRQVYMASGVECEMLSLGRDGIDSEELLKTSAEILHITPYRSFPSGVTATASKRHEYLRWAEKKDRYIVEDDFESEFSLSHKAEETLFSLSSNENVIYINTFSKTISSSLRVGYMVLPEKLISLYEERLGFYSCSVPTFEQYVLAELISNGDFERHINRVRRKRRKELKNL